MIDVKHFPIKYKRPITVAALLDTEATFSVLNPTIFPQNMWKEHPKLFKQTIMST